MIYIQKVICPDDQYSLKYCIIFLKGKTFFIVKGWKRPTYKSI